MPKQTPGETEAEAQLRFTTELEFVQSLANPEYLHHLAKSNYFNEAAFVKYLEYLTYWNDPSYAKYIMFPHCLYFLRLLQHEEFREELRKVDFKRLLEDQQYWHWYWRKKAKPLSAGDAGSAPAGSA